MHFGSALEAALKKATSNGKRKKPMSEAQQNARVQATLVKWLGQESVQKRYRDPAVKLGQGGVTGA